MIAKYDVLIAGAGPAGMGACHGLSGTGLGIALVDRRQEQGSPGRPPQLIHERVLSDLDIGSHSVIGKLRELRVHLPKRPVSSVRPSNVMVLDREAFDRELLRLCAREGAEVSLKTNVLEAKRSGNGWLLTVSRFGELSRMECRYLIIADGSDSPLGRNLMGISPLNSTERFASVYLGMVSREHTTENTTPTADRSCTMDLTMAWHPHIRTQVLHGPGSEIGLYMDSDDPLLDPSTLMELARGYARDDLGEGSVIKVVEGYRAGPTMNIDRITTGAAVVGDAGRLMDPITGWGMTLRLQSAFYFGRALGRAWNSPKRDTDLAALMNTLETRIRERIRSEGTMRGREGELRWDSHTTGSNGVPATGQAEEPSVPGLPPGPFFDTTSF